jgi:hypothetical protein
MQGFPGLGGGRGCQRGGLGWGSTREALHVALVGGGKPWLVHAELEVDGTGDRGHSEGGTVKSSADSPSLATVPDVETQDLVDAWVSTWVHSDPGGARSLAIKMGISMGSKVWHF